MPAKGILSKKTFFPKNGDTLIDLEDETTWECVRACTYTDRTGKQVKFALLIGRAKRFGDEPIPKVIDNFDLPLDFLKSVDRITRKGVKYTKNVKGNYEES